jgi:hypothetical protein
MKGKLMNINILKRESIQKAAGLARGDGLSVLHHLCETQKTVSTKKVLEHVERTEGFMKDCAAQMRKLIDVVHPITVFETDDWHEDLGTCLFFHFHSFEEPPEVYCGSPLGTDFDSDYWAYFIKGMPFNIIFEQAEKLHNAGLAEYSGN